MEVKTQIGVKISTSVWKQVRLKSINNGTTAGVIVEAALRSYLGMDSPFPDTGEADQVSEIIRANKYVTALELADILNEAGLVTARGKAFNRNTASKLRAKLKSAGRL